MRRDTKHAPAFAKHAQLTNKAQKVRRRIRIFILSSIMLSMLGVFFFLTFHYPVLFSNYFSAARGWVVERKNHLGSKLVKMKKGVIPQSEKEDRLASTHFEFYTALPNMQMSRDDVVNKIDENLSTESHSLSGSHRQSDNL